MHSDTNMFQTHQLKWLKFYVFLLVEEKLSKLIHVGYQVSFMQVITKFCIFLLFEIQTWIVKGKEVEEKIK